MRESSVRFLLNGDRQILIEDLFLSAMSRRDTLEGALPPLGIEEET